MRTSIITQGLEGQDFEQHLVQLFGDRTVVRCRALIAFVTLDGLLRIGIGPDGPLRNFVRRGGQLEAILCTDSVTTADALTELIRLQGEARSTYSIKSFRGRLFEADGRLFHPKVFIFEKSNGQSVILVGSNNLTPGGLSNNVEVSVRLDDVSREELREWDHLWQISSSQVGDISQSLIDRVRENHIIRRTVRRPRVRRPSVEESEEPSPRILIRPVPRAGGRTSQVHFTREIVEEFFRLRIGRTSRIRLQQMQPGAPPGPVENRVLVYSNVNKNPKIEVAGVKPIGDYGEGQRRPILIFEEVEAGFFRYMVLLTRSNGYDEVEAVVNAQPSRGIQLPFLITDLERLLEVWPGYPH